MVLTREQELEARIRLLEAAHTEELSKRQGQTIRADKAEAEVQRLLHREKLSDKDAQIKLLEQIVADIRYGR
jgi:hypothetical protein